VRDTRGEAALMTALITPRNTVVAALLLLLALLPVYCSMSGDDFLMSLFSRVLILAIAAVSLNLIMGFGGMVSFGHAAYLGIGGYAFGILAKEGITSGFIQWPMALAACGVFALIVGALSLRTRGVYFIMITLAFAQMIYYVASGLDRYGGDDGTTIQKRSQFFDPINLSNKTFFYYLCLVLLLVCLYIVWRLVNSRFGMAIQGARSNERRMRAIGFPVFRYKLTCFVIAGMMCGLAGVLLANHSDFISPATMFWTRSGDLMVMAVLGGMGSVFGPVIGTVVFLVLEEVLSGFTEYSNIILGPILLLVAIYWGGGIDGALQRLSGRKPPPSLRAKRSNPEAASKDWIASSLNAPRNDDDPHPPKQTLDGGRSGRD
jgi:branched-chain amino acid transport system permease protein